MAVDLNSEDAERMRKLVPLATLPATLFNELCKEVSVEELKDMPLFEKGDTDNDLVYLIDGEVALQSEGLVIDVISSGHEASKFALAHQLPRKIDAVAKGVVRFLRFETERINKQPQLECIEQNEMKVEEEAVAEDRSDDWMTVFLREPIYQRLPPANLQKILISLEEVSAKKGKVIIAQGEAGDYFYFLKCGQCTVSRRPSPGAREVRLGVMAKGETFGEDALITDMPCMVSITAMTDVVLLRLNKKQFIDLIKTPSLNFISYENLSSLQHDMILLDIRPSDEFLISHLDGSINMPFFSLRMQYKSLNREKRVIVICRDGRISEAGAFFLLKHGMGEELGPTLHQDLVACVCDLVCSAPEIAQARHLPREAYVLGPHPTRGNVICP